MMPGVDVKAICDALLAAFKRNDLDQLMMFQLSENLFAVVPDGALKDVVFELVKWAEMHGRTTELVRAAYLERPSNPAIVRIYEKYGMAPTVSVQAGGAVVASAPQRATAQGLEVTIRRGIPAVDIAIWREKLAQVEGRVCRIEFNSNPKGTGFLVGPDLVLTNYHVMEQVIEGKLSPDKVGFRFDYKALNDGSRSEGVVVRLAADNGWNLDHSRYSAAEKDDMPDRELPTMDELDFALVRLATAIGNEPIAKNGASGAPRRGWIEMPEADLSFTTDMPLLIAQHPDGSPMKLAMDTESVIAVNGNGTRVRYRTNTEGGSSGSPCFTFDWSLAALHHLGDPSWKAQFNQGVPIARIRSRPSVSGALAAIE